MIDGALRLRERPLRRRLLVLVAEERDVTYEVVRLLCEMEGASVLRAMTARAAIALARVGQPDLILMDTCLADGNSTRAVRALRRDAWTRSIPIETLSSGWGGAGPTNPSEVLRALRRRLTGLSPLPGRRGRGGPRPRPR
jgi:DNA-binding NarL/FixJ family response regulator